MVGMVCSDSRLFWRLRPSFFGVYPFLAVTERVPADTLVVEGWIPPFAIRAAVDEFRSGSYKQVITTGGPATGTGAYTNDYNTSASVGADELKAAGIPADHLAMAPSRVMLRDRTYASAVALRDWLKEHHVEPNRIMIVTESVHARRSRFSCFGSSGIKTRCS